MSNDCSAPKLECPICHKIYGVRRVSENKGISKFYCSHCCSELHKDRIKGLIRVFKVTVMGDLEEEVICFSISKDE